MRAHDLPPAPIVIEIDCSFAAQYLLQIQFCNAIFNVAYTLFNECFHDQYSRDSANSKVLMESIAICSRSTLKHVRYEGLGYGHM